MYGGESDVEWGGGGSLENTELHVLASGRIAQFKELYLCRYTGAVPDRDYSIQVADNPELSIPESRQVVLLAIAEKLDNMTKV